MGFWGRERTVLVMWEYTCTHSPIWTRGDDLDVGPIDARELGLSEALRDDLADWNDRIETAADPSDVLPDPVLPAAWRALEAESYPLAARVQRELGDAWTVWCLAGGGDGMLDAEGWASTRRFGGPQLLLDRTGVHGWSPDGVEPVMDRFGATLRREVLAWTAAADRLPPAEHRAEGLDLAGRLHGAIASGRVLWFGGAGVPR